MSTSIADAYQNIQQAISAALTATNDSELVKQLLAESNAARSAYTTATNAAFNETDTIVQPLLTQLKPAADAISDTTQAINNMIGYMNKIQNAVGILAKVASVV